MKVNINSPNPALHSIFTYPDQMITLDANFLIPPYRNNYTKKSFNFPIFQKIWLDPIFKVFPNLAIHEAVYDELVMPSIQTYIQKFINSSPPRLVIHKDSTLTEKEKLLRDVIEEKIYPLTRYDPLLDNKDDRGEVKSLAYIAVKGMLYFAANDSNAIQLIEKAEEWMTGLDNVQAIKMYEIIYCLYKIKGGDPRALRMLYKYQYYLTHYEQKINPEWRQFISVMENLYS